jgi:hypothetical protein
MRLKINFSKLTFSPKISAVSIMSEGKVLTRRIKKWRRDIWAD